MVWWLIETGVMCFGLIVGSVYIAVWAIDVATRPPKRRIDWRRIRSLERELGFEPIDGPLLPKTYTLENGRLVAHDKEN